jgi:hypothetical protein
MPLSDCSSHITEVIYTSEGHLKLSKTSQLKYISYHQRPEDFEGGSAKSTLAQQFPATVSWEFGHSYDTNIIRTDTS